MPNLIKAVDVSSNNPDRTQETVNQWVADGCQLLIVKAYSNVEPVALQQTTREWCALAKAAGLWHLPYCWLYGSANATEAVTSAAQLWAGITGEFPSLMFLDCEDYENRDGSIDHGPSVAQIFEAFDALDVHQIGGVIYTGNGWLAQLAERDAVAELAHMAAWIADYRDPPEPTLDVPNPYGLDIIGRQYTSKPQDWSVFDYDGLLAEATVAVEPESPTDTPETDTSSDWPPDAIQAVSQLRAELIEARSNLGVLTVHYAAILDDIMARMAPATRKADRLAIARDLSNVVLAMRQLRPPQ